MPRRPYVLTLLIALVALCVPASAAVAAKVRYPTVKRVTPLKLRIGEPMTVTGTSFVRGKNKNVVVFKRDGKAAVFAKASSATRTKLVVTVPEKLLSQLDQRDGVRVAARFRVRVLAKRFGRRYTKLGLSPVISPSITPAGQPTATKTATDAPAPDAVDCDMDGTPNGTDPDDDNDQLVDVVEAAIGTQTCNADSDGDGVSDNYEYRSAYDLNQTSCPAPAEHPSPYGYGATPCAAALPYPSKRPYANPLDGSDADNDYDGDWLTVAEEFRASELHTIRPNEPLWYSDGLQASIDANPSDGCRGLTPPAASATGGFSLDRGYTNGCLSDDERDEDGDFLSNVEETLGQLSRPEWWEIEFQEPAFQVKYRGTDWLTRDSDGDGVGDGLDDQDFDDFQNIEELFRGTRSNMRDPLSGASVDTGIRTGLWVNPFNPCLPSPMARTCPVSIPQSGNAWRPFYKFDEQPALNRWPLYGDPLVINGQWGAFTYESWLNHDTNAGTPTTQPMPPAHPLAPAPQ